MSVTTPIEPLFEQLLLEASKDYQLNKDSLSDLKKASAEYFLETGLPNKKSESYKFTSIPKFLNNKFDALSQTKKSAWSKESIRNHFYNVGNANHLVFINGRFDLDNSLIHTDASDMEVHTVNASSFDTIDFLKGNFATAKGMAEDVFAHLNTAVFEDGLAIRVSKGADVAGTFVYNFVDGGAFSSPRIFVKAESSSRINFYERTVCSSTEENHLNLSIAEFHIADNAEVRYTKVQNYSINYYSIEGIYADQGNNSRFYTNTYSFKAALIRNNIFITVDGENAEAHMNGLYQLSGNTHVDNNTSVDHVKPNSYSNETYKGILDEKSRGVFNGKIYVRPIAQKTNAFQANNNILLSEESIIHTKPQLEIWADDVKCSHGCTTGQLDEEAIFYLRSRGISKTRAKALMLNAFANETLLQVKEELVKAEIEEITTRKLG
ncbi:MAG: Fe-S cluster assembly protein SufD [Marinoscillum sp.]|jgi:Fe-S cluster assembly protein SufD